MKKQKEPTYVIHGKVFVEKEKWVHDGTWFNVCFGRVKDQANEIASYRSEHHARKVARLIQIALLV